MKKVNKKKETLKKQSKELLEDVPDVEELNFSDLKFEDEEENRSAQLLKKRLHSDVFDYCAQKVANGDQIRYEIQKNGMMEGYRFHPYSWEQLQKDYGQGNYSVKARSTLTNTYVKAETKAVNDYKPEHNPEEEAFKPQAAPSRQEPSFIELFSLMQNATQNSRNEAREVAKEQASQSNALIQALLSKPESGIGTKELMLLMSTMMQNNKKDDSPHLELMMKMMDNSQKTAYQMSENTNRMIEKMNENSNRMFEKMNDRFQAMTEKMNSGSKKPEFGIADIISMTENAQKKGFDLFSKMQTLAESKADEKFEMMELIKGAGGQSKEKKSMTETLIETLLPSITTAVAQNKMGGGAVAPVAAPALLPNPRGGLQPERQISQRASQTVIDRGRNHENSAGKAPQAPPQKSKSGGRTSRKGSGNSGIQIGSAQTQLGAPTFNFGKSKSVSKPVQPKLEPKSKPKEPETSTEEKAIAALTLEQKEGLKVYIEKILTNVIGNSLMKRHTPEMGAEEIIKALVPAKVPLKLFLHIIKKTYIIEVIKKFNLPPMVKPWFEEVYDNISNRAGRGNRAEPSIG